MYGPNGIGFPFFTAPVNIPKNPPSVPNKVDKKKATNSSLVPKTKPITANSLMSPPPIPPLDTIAMTRRRTNPITAPRRESHHGCKGINILSIINRAEKNNNTLSGIIMYFKSDTIIMINKEISVHDTKSSNLQPSNNGLRTNKTPVKSSNIGYKGEIDALQHVDFPLKNI